MRNRNSHTNESSTENETKKSRMQIRPIPLYGILICGIVIVLIGLYLFFTETVANGFVRPGRGGISGISVRLNGKAAMLFGLAICIFPICQLIVQRKKR